MTKRISIFLDDREVKVMSFLVKRYGGKPASIIRSILKEKFDQAFPPYKEGKKGGQNPMLVDLTPEQACEQFGGKVDQMARICMFPPEATGMAASVGIPLGDPNDMLKRFNEFREQAGRGPMEI